MNAEVEAEAPILGPPAPHHHDDVTIAIILVLAIAAALVLHYILKNREAHMTDNEPGDDSITDGATVPGPLYAGIGRNSVKGALVTQRVENGRPTAYGAVPVGMSAPPPEYSINDVHLLRGQDQALIQLAVQYECMIKPPWVYEATTQIPDIGAGSTYIGRMTQILSAMMTPPSVAGSQRGNSAKQTLVFLNVGSNTVAVAGEKECKTLHERLNSEYFATIAPYRKRTLDLIIAESKAPTTTLPKSMHSAKCGQTRVVFWAQEEAEGMAETLNSLYAAAVKPELARVLEEIATEAGRAPV